MLTCSNSPFNSHQLLHNFESQGSFGNIGSQTEWLFGEPMHSDEGKVMTYEPITMGTLILHPVHLELGEVG